MITPELRAKIRRLFFAEHWTVGTISSELGLHRDTVLRAIESQRIWPSASPVRPSILDPYKGFIEETLEKHPRLRATRIYDMVRGRGYAGSVVQVRRHVRKIRPARGKEAFLRRETLPGEEAQVDWGHFGKIDIGTARRSLSCFVMVLAHSRAMYARFSLDQTMESFLRGHVLGFEALGGVCRTILYDNLKSVVLEREGENVRFHPSILELAGHYHFAPKPCSPYRANEKGKVERAIQYLRHAFFAAREIRSVEQLNEELVEWNDRVAHQRPCPRDKARRPVHEVYEEEMPRLLPLPEHPFECDLIKPVRSGKTPFVRFDLNDYSIPHALVRTPLTLVASETEVRILDGASDVVARHERSFGRGETIEDPVHLRGLSDLKAKAYALRGRDRLAHHCPSSPALLAAIIDRGEPIRPHTARLNKLVERYGAQAVESAICEVLERGACSAASVAHVLDQRDRRAGKRPALDPILPDDPRVRDLHVKNHDLAEYDRLSEDDEGEEA